MDSEYPQQSLTALPPTYYLDNFSKFLSDVVARYRDLLTPQELSFYDRFMALPVPARCLYVRLVSRKGPLFRLQKLHYPEIAGLKDAVDSLDRAGMLVVNPPVELATLLELYTQAELQQLFPGAPRSLRKNQLVQHICDDQNAEDCSTRWYDLMGSKGVVLQPLHLDVLNRFRLMFFGNRGQDLTEFVLSDLGLVRYENYALDGAAAAFQTRGQVDELLEAIKLRDRVEELVQADVAQGDEILDQMLQGGFASLFPPARRQFSKAYNHLARHRERQGNLVDASVLYRFSSQPPARERLARVLYALEDYRGALAQCELILEGPWDEHERACAVRIIERCRRQLEPQVKRARGSGSRKVVLFPVHRVRLVLPRSGVASVERLALDYLLQTGGGQGAYVENWLMNALFGLLFWDIVFAPVPDAFYHPFQRGPRDLYEAEFLHKRAPLLAERLEWVGQGQGLDAAIADVWSAKYGLANSFVFWADELLPVLQTAVSRIPAYHLQCMFRRMLTDLRNHCSGFPDLVLFPEQGGYELVEVKGPGDRLQDNQKRWMAFFLTEGIPASVLHVEYIADDSPASVSSPMPDSMD